MTWGYEGRELEPGYFAVVEVYKDTEGGGLIGITGPVEPVGSSLAELAEDLRMMLHDVEVQLGRERDSGTPNQNEGKGE